MCCSGMDELTKRMGYEHRCVRNEHSADALVERHGDAVARRVLVVIAGRGRRNEHAVADALIEYYGNAVPWRITVVDGVARISLAESGGRERVGVDHAQRCAAERVGDTHGVVFAVLLRSLRQRQRVLYSQRPKIKRFVHSW